MTTPTKLNKNNFSFTSNEKEIKITITNAEKNSGYCATLIACDESKTIITNSENFKEGKVKFRKLNLPIFYLIYSLETPTDEINHLNQKIGKLHDAMRGMESEYGTEFYNSTLKKALNDMVLNINSYFKNKNAEIFIELLAPYKTSIDLAELSQSLDAKKSALKQLINYQHTLIEIKSITNNFINNFFNPQEPSQYEKFLDKTADLVDTLAKLINKKEENFLASPIIPIDERKLKEIAQTYKTIENYYFSDNGILQNYQKMLSNREAFVYNAIEQLDLFKKSLQETRFADDVLTKIETEELFHKKLPFCENILQKLQENLPYTTETEYCKRKNIYLNFHKDLVEKLKGYKKISGEIIKTRKAELDLEANKFLAENKIDVFKKTLADEILSEFENHSTYHKYTELLAEIDNELANGCMSLKKVEELKKEIDDLSPQLKLLKKEFDIENKKVIQTRKEKIFRIQRNLSEIEEKLTSISKELYGITTDNFPKNEIDRKLQQLTVEIQKFDTNKSLILNKKNLDSIRKKAEGFKADFESKVTAANKKSDENIRTKLHNLRQNTAILEATDFSENLNTLLTKPNLTRSQLENVVNEFSSLRIDTFRKKLDSIREKLDAHIKKLEGENPISLLERLINLIARTITKEKIKIEKQGVLALDKLKEHITNPSSHNDTATLDKYCQETDSIFKNEFLMTHRSFLFFKFNTVTSEQIAKEATELLGELKTAFKI